MPRGRGGQRNGKVGKAYQNRTDLNGQNVVTPQAFNPNLAKLASTAVPGQAYGAAGAQLAAQKAVPMGATANPTPSLSLPQVNAATQPAPQTGMPSMPPVTPLNQPTTHGLPVMTGLPQGAGAGPEAMMQTVQTAPAQQALTQLNSLGTNVSPTVNFVRNFLAMQAENQGPH